MPRRKTIQPEPLLAFELDGQAFEIRDKNTWGIGRGQNKKFLSRETNSQILNGLIDDLQSCNKKREKRAMKALSSQSALDRYITEAGYEMDERTGRRHGKCIIKEYQLLMKLVEEGEQVQ